MHFVTSSDGRDGDHRINAVASTTAHTRLNRHERNVQMRMNHQSASVREPDRRTRRVLVRKSLCVVALAGVGLVSACGGSSSSGPSSSGSPSASALSGPKVVFGVIASESGTGVTQNSDVSTAAKDWQDYTNAHGGIGGDPVSVIVKDDSNNAATALQDAQELIKNDHAVAIGDASFTATSFAKYADAAKVPVISMGGAGASTLYLSDPNFFTNMTTIPGAVYAFAKTAQLAGAKSFGLLYCAESPTCAQSVPLFKAAAKGVGLSFGYSAAVSASTPNYTAVCLAAKSAGVDSLAVVSADQQENQHIYDNCATQNYSPIVLNNGSTFGPSGATDSKIPVQWQFTPTLSPNVKSAATAPFRTAMAGYLSSASVLQNVMNAWVGLEVFGAAAKAGVTTGAAPTATGIYNGLYSLKGFTAGGLTGPLTFSKTAPTQSNCFFLSKLDHGNFSTPKGTAPICEASAAGQQ
jgi:branched-chain amino acid transport system substrate-binding protein